MFRPALVLACAAAATVAFAAPAAAANPTCVNTTGGAFDGSSVCVATDSVISHYVDVPYSVGSVCVGGVCTTEISGTVRVPVPDTSPAHVYGTVCYDHPKLNQVCVPFSSDLNIEIG